MKRNLIIVAVVLLAFVWWFLRWCEPERQVRRAQAHLLGALESGDYDSLATLMADDYLDGWGHDKAFVLRKSREVFSQFVTLTIDREERGLETVGNQWLLKEKLTLRGLGGGLAMAIREKANGLHGPFATVWRKRSWKPWDWELMRVEQAEITAAEMEISF